ncbi:glycosyltransferase [Reinekea sp. G2M2-21]|uniref:glycosyltransferase n=1 Tax=Reinekea sp. G2M2-21 TaxID=2788942 RepID=UPI0018AA3BAA|nr:glycosyltransferase [Reinekea sp. G2M2-21]
MANSPRRERLKVMHVISGDLWAGAEVQAYYTLKNLLTHSDVTAVLLNHGELADRLMNCGVTVIILDEQKLSSLTIFLRLAKLIRNDRPNVIHTHRLKENILASLANAFTTRTKCVRTVHGDSEHKENLKSKIINLIDNWVGNNLQSKIIVVSSQLKEVLLHKFRSDRLFVLRNAIDLKELRQKAQEGAGLTLNPQKTHVGLVGRLVSVKRADIFINIAKLIQNKEPDQYQFHIIGDGPLREALNEQVKCLNLENMVIFHGFRTDSPSCIAALDAVIMCSDHEGLPMVALEALCLEKLLISHQVGGLVELNHPNHILIPNNKPESYVDALLSTKTTITEQTREFDINTYIENLLNRVYQ